MPLILASSSPRRLALLAQIGVHARAVPADIDETPRPGESPEAACLRFAREKAAAIAARFPQDAVLAADTIGILDGRLLGKPKDADDAYGMLQSMAGRPHTVLTAFCLRKGEYEVYESVASTVLMRAFDEALVRRYIAAGEPLDKAGAYGIQGAGALLVESITGDFYAVAGLPLSRAALHLPAFGVEILP